MAVVKMNPLSTGPGSQEQPEAIECVLSWCARSYDLVEVAKGRLLTPVVTEYLFDPSADSYITSSFVSLIVFTVPLDATNFTGNRTFTINLSDCVILGTWLEETFTQQD